MDESERSWREAPKVDRASTPKTNMCKQNCATSGLVVNSLLVDRWLALDCKYDVRSHYV